MLDIKALEAEVRRLAAEKPDFIYPPQEGNSFRCLYKADDKQPGCIMGQALTNLNLLLPVENTTISNYLSNNGVPYNTHGWFSIVQRAQDNGCSWADAIRLADAVGG